MSDGIAGTCAIWGTAARHLATTWGGIVIDSPRAGGRYGITGTAITTAQTMGIDAKVRLTSWLVDQHLQGIAEPRVDSSLIESAALLPARSVPKRRDRVLQLLVLKTRKLGQTIRFENGAPDTLELLAWSESIEANEARFLLGMLADDGWVARQVVSNAVDATVLEGGYEKFEEMRSATTMSMQGFVAMWFDSSMDDIFTTGIAEGIKDAGYSPVRIDHKHHNNKIDDEIIAEIRRSRFVVADFTHGDGGARGGVYYEAGFAHGLGIPVVFTIREDMIDRAHFDTRQYSHLLWKDAADLRTKLGARISATIGDGPLKPR